MLPNNDIPDGGLPARKSLRRMLFLLVPCILPLCPARAQGGAPLPAPDSLLIIFWNVENLFDCDGTNGGGEWTAEGEKHWTPGRLRAKCNAIGKTLLWIGEQEGRLPDIVALAEVENAGVLRRLIHSAPLRKAGYRYVHFDSPDPRGIDVALLYRKDCFAFKFSEDTPDGNGDAAPQVGLRQNALQGLRSEAIPIPDFRTRDMLRCRFPLNLRHQPGHDLHDSVSNGLASPPHDTTDGQAGSSHDPTGGQVCDTLTLLVVHHPSKLGDAARSRARRETAMRILRNACLADASDGPHDTPLTGTSDGPNKTPLSGASACYPHARALTVVTGDFNDTPDGEAFRMLDSCLVCLSRPLHQRGEGSLKYDGKWELIDQFWVSPDLAPGCTTAVVYAPFLLTRDSAHAGLKPLRTYSGPRYLGGVSDHLPVILRLRFPERLSSNDVGQ